MIKGKLSIGSYAHNCYVCSGAGIYNVKNIKSYNEAGWGLRHAIEPMPDCLLDFILTKCPTVTKYLTLTFAERKTKSKSYRLCSDISNDLVTLNYDKKMPAEVASIYSSLDGKYEQIFIIASMLRKLVFINKKAYLRNVANFNKKTVKLNAKPRTYPTCWYVCSEECLNMLILQKS